MLALTTMRTIAAISSLPTLANRPLRSNFDFRLIPHLNVCHWSIVAEPNSTEYGRGVGEGVQLWGPLSPNPAIPTERCVATSNLASRTLASFSGTLKKLADIKHVFQSRYRRITRRNARA